MKAVSRQFVLKSRLLLCAACCSVALISGSQPARAQAATNTAAPLSKYVLPEHCDTWFGKKPRVYLNGYWKRKFVDGQKGYDQTDEGTSNRFWTVGYDDSGWQTCRVPRKIKVGRRKWDDTTKSGLAYYRRTVNIPAEHKGRRAILTFERVSWEPVIWVNGTEVARPKNLIPSSSADVHRIDITSLVRWGEENEITVRLYIPKLNRLYRRYPSGIWAPCWIDFRPPVYCKQMLITPKLPDTIDVRCVIMNTSTRSASVALRAVAEPWQGEPAYHARLTGKSTATAMALPGSTVRPGENRIRFSMKIRDPVWWDTFNPFLYSLKLFNGKTRIGWDRFGLREFTIRDQYFYLNGHRVFLSGVSTDGTDVFNWYSAHNSEFQYNRNGFLERMFELRRASNINMTVCGVPTWTAPRTLDLHDELGMLAVVMWHVLMEAAYSDYGKQFVNSDVEGYLHEALRRQVVAVHNHPSVVAYTPEGEANRVPGVMLNLPLYRSILEKYDASRVFTSHQSNVMNARLPGKQWYPNPYNTEWVPLIPPPPYDFLNPAALSGSGTPGWIHTLIPEYLRRHSLHWNRFFFSEQKPSIFTEGLYYFGYRSHTQYWPGTLKKYGGVLKDGKLDKKLYCDLYGVRVPADQPHMNYHPKDIKIVGIRNAFDKSKIYPRLARYVGEMIEFVRMNDDVIQGFGSCAGPTVKMPPKEDVWRMNPAQLGENVFSRMMKKTCAPVFVCADLHWKHNFFAGREYAMKVFCFNYFARDLPDAGLAIDLLNEQGQVLLNANRRLGVLVDGSRRELTHHLRVPAQLETGNYRIRFRLSAAGKLHSENEYDLFVLSKADLAARLATKKRVAVANSRDGIIYQFGPSRVLGRLGVNTDYLQDDYSKSADYANLADYDVVVIAPGHTRDINAENSAALLEYLQNGGRIVCLAQTGTIPWLPDLKLRSPSIGRGLRYPGIAMGEIGAIGISGDRIEPDHPVFAGIGRLENWQKWSAPYGRLFRRLAFPLSESVVLAGGTNKDRSGKTPGLRFGMLIAELKVGKGIMLLSQVEAMDLYGYDAVATKYLHNLFAYALGEQWDGRYAAPLRSTGADKKELSTKR